MSGWPRAAGRAGAQHAPPTARTAATPQAVDALHAPSLTRPTRLRPLAPSHRSFTTIRLAGHMVPQTQPVFAYKMAYTHITGGSWTDDEKTA